MQRHEVPLHDAESWGGGGWGQTARHEPSGGVVPSRLQAGGMSCAGDHIAPARARRPCD